MRLEEVLQAGRPLTAEEAAALAERLLPRWQARRRTLDARNAAILAAMAATGESTPTAAAEALQRAMRRRATGAPVQPADLAAGADAVLQANEGKPLSWQSIAAVERAARIAEAGS